MAGLDVPGGLEKKSAEYWEEMYWKCARQYGEHNKQLVRFLDLELLNHKQAGMLMEWEQRFRCLKDVYESMLVTFKNRAEELEVQMKKLEEVPDWEILAEASRIIHRSHLPPEVNMKKIQEDKDTANNIIDIAEARLALAAKEPPTSGNWLSELEKGTRFLAALKNYPEPVLGDFVVASDPKAMKPVYLGYDLSSREGGFKFFDPVAFSQKYRLFDILQTEVPTDDNIDVPTGTMEGNGEG